MGVSLFSSVESLELVKFAKPIGDTDRQSHPVVIPFSLPPGKPDDDLLLCGHRALGSAISEQLIPFEEGEKSCSISNSLVGCSWSVERLINQNKPHTG